MGELSLSTLATTGASASSGRLRDARETRSRTSLAALSISRVSRNSIRTLEVPSRLVERIVLMPSIPLTAPSITWVIWDSITSADAPSYVVLIDTTGGSTAGYSRTGSLEKAKMPKTTSSALTTMASTGRWIEMSESTMAQLPAAVAGGVAGVGASALTGAPSRTRWVPRTMTSSPGFTPSSTCTMPFCRRPMVIARRCARPSATTKMNWRSPKRDQRFFRDQHGIGAGRKRQPDIHEHAGLQPQVARSAARPRLRRRG